MMVRQTWTRIFSVLLFYNLIEASLKILPAQSHAQAAAASAAQAEAASARAIQMGEALLQALEQQRNVENNGEESYGLLSLP